MHSLHQIEPVHSSCRGWSTIQPFRAHLQNVFFQVLPFVLLLIQSIQ
eukprot:02130.XXX_6547_6687_1 [CDS] Oithona nana genome sequencing.